MRFSQPTTKNVSNVIRIVKVTGLWDTDEGEL
jgi:hypothetical protein